MIEFHLDGRSGVPAYLQLVQQVRQAIRLGILRPGDQLPTVKEVVAQPDDQPEHRSARLPAARPRGTGRGPARRRHVRRDPVPPPPADDLKGLRSSLERWVARARAAGLDDEGDRRAVRRGGATDRGLEGVHERRRRDSHRRARASATARRWALRDCTLEIPTGSVTALVGPNGAGKTTLLHLVIGLGEPTSGDVEVLGRSPQRDAKALLPRLGFVAQDHPLYRGPDDRRDAQVRAQAQPAAGTSSCAA